MTDIKPQPETTCDTGFRPVRHRLEAGATWLSLFLPLILAVPAWADDLEAHYRQKIEQLLPGMAAPAILDRKDAQQELEKLCHEAGTPGKDADREALSKAVMGFTGPDVAKPVRIWMLRKIEPLGKDEVVAGLTGLLSDADADVRESARRALANNPSQQALEALRAQLGKGDDVAWQVALINALAWRRDSASVPRFIELTRANAPEVAVAAISALGEIGDDASAKALIELQRAMPAGLAEAIVDASLRAGERLRRANKTVTASSMYQNLTANRSSETIYIAALTGMARTLGTRAAPGLVDAVKGTNVRFRLVAARLLTEMGPDATPIILSGVANSAPEAKAMLVEVLGDRGDPAALKAVVEAVGDDHADVRLAALEAVGKLGDGSSVNLLVDHAAQAAGEEREAARRSLAMLKSQNVDTLILERLAKAQGPARLELIQAVWGRRIAAAKPALLAMAGSEDEAVRTGVLSAMERLANQEDLPKLADMLARAVSEPERNAGVQAMLSVCRRAGDPEAAAPPVIAALARADARGQAALLRALGQLQTADALAAVRRASTSTDPSVRSTALEVLKRWKPVRITGWQYAGPYRQEGKGSRELFDIAFAPEKEPAGGEFKALRGRPREDGSIDLKRIPGAADNSCCYVKATIESDRKQDLILSLGSDDGIKVWLNGQQVHAQNVERALRCDEEQAQVTLNEGTNSLLVKVTQGGSDWSLCVGVRAADGAPPEGLRFEAR